MGVMEWPDGTKYTGQFKEGKMEGKGTKTWPNGNRYDGLWRNDLQHGPGTFYSKKNNKETPEEWRDGKQWTWNRLSTVIKDKNASRVSSVWQTDEVTEREKNWAR